MLTSTVRGLLLTLLAGATLSCGEATESVDCSPCETDELCWYTTGFEGELDGSGCIAWPAACADDRSCECVNADTAAGEGCDELGYEQNGDACQLEATEPVLYCVSTLG